MVRWWYAILFFSVSVCACVCTNKASVCVCVYFSVLVPRSHMTPPSPPPCFGLFLNIPCSEVQRVVYRDFPFMRVPLSLCLTCVVSLSPSVSRSLFFISLTAYIFGYRIWFLTIVDELTDPISVTVNNTDVSM